MRALVVGMGGLGCPAALALGRGGVSELTLVDPDRVDLTNLHRQVLYAKGDVGRSKVERAAEVLGARYPSVRINVHVDTVDLRNARGLFAQADVVIDAVDGLATKFLLSDAAVKARVPLIYAGAVRWSGLAMRVEPSGPCLRCLFEAPPRTGPTCAQVGVLGPLVGLVGALQAGLALSPPKVEPDCACLFDIDALTLKIRTRTVRRRTDCDACGGAS